MPYHRSLSLRLPWTPCRYIEPTEVSRISVRRTLQQTFDRQQCHQRRGEEEETKLQQNNTTTTQHDDGGWMMMNDEEED